MKFTLFLALSLAVVPAAFAEVPAGWGTNFTATLADAKAQHRPVLVFFTASWCGPCKMMVRSTLTNDAVIKALGAFSCMAADIDEQQPLARVHEISAVPTFKVLTPEGDAVESTEGFQTPDVFVPWLTNAVVEYTAAIVRREAAGRKLAEADALLLKGDAASVQAGAAALFDLCAQRDSSVSQPAIARLTELVQHHPAALLQGLEHPRLAARIQAANLLRSRLGEAFDADPWADAETRRKVVARWREKLVE
jgi:thioredoxin-like negative regulator of GroEL